MMSKFSQIGITSCDNYKITFIVPCGHCEWNNTPFVLKTTPSEFQYRMN